MIPNPILSDQGTIYPKSMTLTFHRNSCNSIPSLRQCLSFSGARENSDGYVMVTSQPSLTYSFYLHGTFTCFVERINLNYVYSEGKIAFKDSGTNIKGNESFNGLANMIKTLMHCFAACFPLSMENAPIAVTAKECISDMRHSGISHSL